MYKIIEATYHQGNLILKDKLSQSFEGKKIKVIILEESNKKENFLDKVDKHSFKLPKEEATQIISEIASIFLIIPIQLIF